MINYSLSGHCRNLLMTSDTLTFRTIKHTLTALHKLLGVLIQVLMPSETISDLFSGVLGSLHMLDHDS